MNTTPLTLINRKKDKINKEIYNNHSNDIQNYLSVSFK